VLTGVGGVTLGIDNGTGVVFLIVREFRCEMFGDIGGDEHSEFIGVMVAAEDGCQYCGKGVLLVEKVCDEGSSTSRDVYREKFMGYRRVCPGRHVDVDMGRHVCRGDSLAYQWRRGR
jgi:hypothetical protein